MESKYRGTTRYFHVMAELVRAAQYRGVTTYQDMAVMMGLPVTGAHMGRETGQMLREISHEEVAAHRPMLSAVVVSVQGKPGPGFFVLAKELGRLRDGDEEQAFWQRECEAVYESWRRPLPDA